MNTRRLSWIDYAKVFSICLVVSYHTPPRSEGFGDEMVSTLRMPAFFLIAGFLFDAGKFPSFMAFLKHRGRQLLIPYASFSLIFYLLWLAFGREMAGDTAPLSAPITEFLTGRPTLIIAPFWFVVCLFTLQTVYYLLQRFIPRHRLFPACLVLPILLTFLDVPQVWQLFNALLYLPFYAFANCFKELISKLSFVHHKIEIFCTLPIAVGIIYLRHHFITEASSGIWTDLLCWAMFIAAGILLLPTYIGCCKIAGKWFGPQPLIETIGKNTIIILALHNYYIGLLLIIADRLSGQLHFLEHLPWLNLPITLLVVFSLYYPILAINRWAPFLIGRPWQENFHISKLYNRLSHGNPSHQ